MADLLQTVGSPALTSLTDQFDPSEDDLMLMKRVLGAAAARPDLLPTPFLAYLSDYLQAGDFSVTTNQIAGFARFSPTASDQIDTNQTTSSTSYTDLGTVGPEIVNLSDGNYIVLMICLCAVNGTIGDGTYMAPSINGSTPSDSDAAQTKGTAVVSAIGVSLQKLSAGSNTIRAKYRVSTGGISTASFQQRRIIAIRYANI